MEERPHLYIIPIAHTYADMGGLRDKIPVDEGFEAKVTQYWVEIFLYLRGLPPDHLARLRIYQDGLVNGPREIVDEIVDETPTANYEILRWLKEQGAQILGTENPDLLMEEHQSLQAIANCPDGEAKTARLAYLKKSRLLLEERDQYMAHRIKETLPNGEIGLLFIGVAHNIGPFLGNEIRVTELEIGSRALPEALRDFYNLGEERK